MTVVGGVLDAECVLERRTHLHTAIKCGSGVSQTSRGGLSDWIYVCLKCIVGACTPAVLCDLA